jgi:hypothetical protein
MSNLTKLLKISCQKHGKDYPLTIGHLLNISRMLDKKHAQRTKFEEKQHAVLLNELDPLGQEGMR